MWTGTDAAYTQAWRLPHPQRLFTPPLQTHVLTHAHALHYLQASLSAHALLQTYTHTLVCRRSCLFAHRRRHPYACAHTLTLLLHAPHKPHAHPEHAASDGRKGLCTSIRKESDIFVSG
uniref:Uncharacterized protein n=1 Tax=Bubo bubo TaxID=30461 RepID=A0A8C0EH20_BUBBB